MASAWLPKKIREALYWRDTVVKIVSQPAPICAYCEKTCKLATVKGFTRQQQIEHMRANYADIVTVDHIVPRSIAPHLLLSLDNLICVCNGCNSSKKNSDLLAWCLRTGKDYAAIMRRITRIAITA